MYSIVHKLEKIREAKKVAKSKLADQIGVARETVYNWTDENLKVMVLQKACKALDIDILQFFSEDPAYVGKNTQPIAAEPKEKYSADDVDCAQVRRINKFLEDRHKEDKEMIESLLHTLNAMARAPMPEDQHPIKTISIKKHKS